MIQTLRPLMVKIHILGTAQDSGIPQFGCECLVCTNAKYDPTQQRLVSCIAVIGENNIILIDSTPDYRQQVTILNEKYPKIHSYRYQMGADSILITHLHVGHYSGLVNLGKEISSTVNYPVYVTRELKHFFETTKPYAYLSQRNEARYIPMDIGSSIELDSDFSITILEVPHRNEDGNTIGVKILSKKTNKTALYIPDIDYLTLEILELIKTIDVVLFDGTFYSKEEHPNQANIPHPPMIETIDKIGEREQGSFYFIHLNHTNPALKFGPEFKHIQDKGYLIANDNQIIEI